MPTIELNAGLLAQSKNLVAERLSLLFGLEAPELLIGQSRVSLEEEVDVLVALENVKNKLTIRGKVARWAVEQRLRKWPIRNDEVQSCVTEDMEPVLLLCKHIDLVREGRLVVGPDRKLCEFGYILSLESFDLEQSR